MVLAFGTCKQTREKAEQGCGHSGKPLGTGSAVWRSVCIRVCTRDPCPRCVLALAAGGGEGWRCACGDAVIMNTPIQQAQSKNCRTPKLGQQWKGRIAVAVGSQIPNRTLDSAGVSEQLTGFHAGAEGAEGAVEWIDGGSG